MAYKDGSTVIVIDNNKVKKVGTVIGSVIQSNTKKRVYDVLLENRSVIASIPIGESKSWYIDEVLTKKLIGNDLIQSTIPYHEMVINDTLPASREESSGPRSF